MGNHEQLSHDQTKILMRFFVMQELHTTLLHIMAHCRDKIASSQRKGMSQ
jgi:hypothetical protein